MPGPGTLLLTQTCAAPKLTSGRSLPLTCGGLVYVRGDWVVVPFTPASQHPLSALGLTWHKDCREEAVSYVSTGTAQGEKDAHRKCLLHCAV